MRDTASLFSFARQYSNTEGSTARRFAAEKGDGVKVNLNKEQQAMLDGEKGETMAKVMKTLIMYGQIFGAEKLVPVTSRYNHLVTSFGLKALGPVYDLMNQLIEAGAVSGQKFSVDPRPLDPNVPANFLQNLVFKTVSYTHLTLPTILRV